jgi:hypothetical protein
MAVCAAQVSKVTTVTIRSQSQYEASFGWQNELRVGFEVLGWENEIY